MTFPQPAIVLLWSHCEWATARAAETWSYLSNPGGKQPPV